MTEIGYGKQKRVLVAVSLPSNYKCTERPSFPLMQLHGWTEEFPRKGALEGQLQRDIAGCHDRRWGWVEECSVWDTLRETALPDEIFVVIQANQKNEGRYAPTSWFGSDAYASRNEAEISAKRQGQDIWKWVVSIRRFPPTSS